MKSRKIFWLLSIILALVLFGAYPGLTGEEPNREARGPVITQAFAAERGYYGEVWRIYVEADDPDGQMLRVASVVDQAGYGHYPTDWIYLEPQYEKHFKGYIQWNTLSTKARYLPEWTQISLKVSVFDKNGNESNEVVFPFTFEMSPKQYVDEPPAPFDQGDLPRLGYISINLVNPFRVQGDRDLGMIR